MREVPRVPSKDDATIKLRPLEAIATASSRKKRSSCGRCSRQRRRRRSVIVLPKQIFHLLLPVQWAMLVVAILFPLRRLLHHGLLLIRRGPLRRRRPFFSVSWRSSSESLGSGHGVADVPCPCQRCWRQVKLRAPRGSEDLFWGANDHAGWAQRKRCDLKHILYHAERHAVLTSSTLTAAQEDGGSGSLL